MVARRVVFKAIKEEKYRMRMKQNMIVNIFKDVAMVATEPVLKRVKYSVRR